MGIIVTVSPVVAAVAALAAKGAALYEDNHSYRVRLDPPVGEKELPGLRRAWIAIRADGPGTVCLSGRLPDGDDLWEEEGAPPEMAVGYWADARDAAHEIYRATARESAVRREAVRLSGGTWSAGRGHAACNDDPADAAPGDTAVLTLRGGTRLTRKGDDEHKWQWSSHDRIRYEDAETLAVLADDTAVGLPRSMALPALADDYRRAWYDDPLAAAVADAIAHAVDGGEAAPLWERQLMGDIPASAEDAINAALDAEEDITITVDSVDGDQWVPALAGPGGTAVLDPEWTGTIPVAAGRDRVRAWLAIILGARAAHAAELDCCGL